MTHVAPRTIQAVEAELVRLRRENAALLADRDRWRDAAETEHVYTLAAESERDYLFRSLAMVLWQNGPCRVTANTQVMLPGSIKIMHEPDPGSMCVVLRAAATEQEPQPSQP